MRADVEAGKLLQAFRQFPHSQPIITTFEHLADPLTYKGYVDRDKIDDEGELFDFSVYALPRRGSKHNYSLSLSAGNPLGPTLDLHFLRGPVNPDVWLGPSIGKITTGYEWQPFSGLSKFKSIAETGRILDPSLPGTRWLLDAIKYFGIAKQRYIKSLPQAPEDREVNCSTHEIYMKSLMDSFLPQAPAVS